jgi:hypothetical protein
MMTERDKARSKAIESELLAIRTRLDQLSQKADDEGIHVERATTEALLEELTSLTILEEHAQTTRNTQLISAVRKERDRCREALGFTVRKRRRK